MSQTPIISRINEIERVWTPEAIWTVPTAHGEANFNFPVFGSGAYDAVVGQVIRNRQRLPTGEKIAFMLDEAYNSVDEGIKHNPRVESVRKIVKDAWLWVPSVNIWTPKSAKTPGMYAVFDEKGEGLSKKYTIEELENRLSGGSTDREVRFSIDRKVAFAPLTTIASGYHQKGTLSKDGAFIAKHGVEGAEKLDNVAQVFSGRPRSWTIDNDSDRLIQTLSALDGGWYRGDDGLSAYFDSYGYRYGYVLSVSGSE